MLEVEVRALVPNSPDIHDRIRATGFTFAGSQRLTDIYYSRGPVTSLKDVSMDEVGSFSLRLRLLDQLQHAQLNVKVIVRESDHSGWQEFETAVVDPDAMMSILKAIGFRELFRLAKTRTTYRALSVNVHIDEIDDFGTGIELETFSETDVKDEAVRMLLNVLDRLEISRDSVVERSLTYLVMQQRIQLE